MNFQNLALLSSSDVITIVAVWGSLLTLLSIVLFLWWRSYDDSSLPMVRVTAHLLLPGNESEDKQKVAELYQEMFKMEPLIAVKDSK